jgi:glycosyltransferase involved in cell wall biosynthesis
MLNVLFIEMGSGHGGSSAYLYSFLKHIDRNKFKPIVLFYQDTGTSKIESIRALGIPVRFLRKKTTVIKSNLPVVIKNGFDRLIVRGKFILKIIFEYLPQAFVMRKLINAEKVQIMLLGSDVQYISNIPAVLAAHFTGISLVVRKSGSGTSWKVNRIQRFFSKYVDLFIASSKSEAEFHKENSLPFKKMVTLYEGTDLDDFKPSGNNVKIRNEFNISQEQFIACSVSRFDEGKGHLDLLKAANLVVKQCPRAVFLIVGGGDDPESKYIEKQLKEETQRLGLDKNIIFTGWRTDITDILEASDIFVHCPNKWREAMGIATLEAMACGKPTVVTKNSGLGETTLDNFSGFVVAPGDYTMLAEKMILLAQNDGKRAEMGRNARLRAEELFDIRRNVKETEILFLDLFK